MSQSKVSGVIQSTRKATKQSRAGNDFTICYATVDGQEFSTGFKQPFSDGEMVNIVVELKYGENQLVEGLAPTNQPLLGSEPPPAPVKKAWGGGAPARKFPVEPTDGQMSIIRQNSMNRAVEILDTWLSTQFGDVLFAPMSQEEYLAKLLEVALTITDFNSGQDIMQLKAAQAANLAIAS